MNSRLSRIQLLALWIGRMLGCKGEMVHVDEAGNDQETAGKFVSYRFTLRQVLFSMRKEVYRSVLNYPIFIETLESNNKYNF